MFHNIDHKICTFCLHLSMLLCSCYILASCVEYHPYDTRVKGEKDINTKNIKKIEEQCAGKRSIKFAVISDTQRWYDETLMAVDNINSRDDIDFVLHTGDLSDFGMRNEFEWQRDILNKLKVPYVCIIGNHDCLASGDLNFKKIFGEFNFAFTAGNIRFVCLNTNALEFGHDVPVPDFDFIEKQIINYPKEAEKTVIAMHAAPFSDQFNSNAAKVFQYGVNKFPGLQFCVNGHDHQFSAEDKFNDGTVYFECANIQKMGYLLFCINEEGYTHEIVNF